MNHPLTPSQLAFHQAHKERTARKLAAASARFDEDQKPVTVQVTYDAPPLPKEKKARTYVRRESRAVKTVKIPKGFTTKFSCKVKQEGEYCPHSGGSSELILKRSIYEIAVSALLEFPGVTFAAVCGHERNLRIRLPRWLVWYTLKERRPEISYPQIGQKTGGFDPTSVMHGVNKIREMIENGTLEAQIEQWHADRKNKPRGRK